MASNQQHHLDSNLNKFYQFDLDWKRLPDRLQQVRCHVSEHFKNESDTFGFMYLSVCLNLNRGLLNRLT